MKSIFVPIVGLAALFISSCSEEPVQPNAVFPLVGTWVERGIEGDTTIMQRAFRLDDDKYGFVFDIWGKFLERKNAGWCGTPPIVYRTFDGEWKWQAEDLLHIDVDYWGGRTQYDMRIISTSLSELRFVRELSQ